jgi:hypothetical protein
MLFSKPTPFADIAKDIDHTSRISRTEQKDIERSFARLFSTEEGKKVLAWLQVMTFHRTGGANQTDEQLRHMEGQRSLMASILRMIDRGKNN